MTKKNVKDLQKPHDNPFNSFKDGLIQIGRQKNMYQIIYSLNFPLLEYERSKKQNFDGKKVEVVEVLILVYINTFF